MALLVLAGCGSTRDKSAPAAAPEIATAAHDGGSGVPTTDQTPIPAATRQLVIGVAAASDATVIRLALFDRDANTASWRQNGEWFDASVGRNGVAWGRGLHGDGPVAVGAIDDDAAPLKVEGDGRAPLGLFRIGGAFGSSPRPPISKMGYTAMKATHRCVDDDASAYYNRIVDTAKIDKVDWGSAEDMLGVGALYELGIVIEHNANAVKRGGSCIFFHVWGGPGATTAGCTAMDKANLTRLIENLDPEAQPLYLLVTKAQYAELAPQWGLPAL